MSGRSKKSSKAIDRPVAAKVLAEARRIAGRYQVILSCEEGHWFGRGLELPHTFADAATPNRCVAKTREALASSVAYLLENDQKPPAPASERVRSLQVNVRLTPEERVVLEATARRKGFKGLSDFIRAAALDAVNGGSLNRF